MADEIKPVEAVVKVQLAHKEKPDEQDMILLFSENGEITYEGPLTEDVRALLNGRQVAYFKGTLRDENDFRISDEVPDPGWEGEVDADV